MLASSMAWMWFSTQVPSTRSSSRNQRCLLRYTSLHAHEDVGHGNPAEETKPTLAARRQGGARAPVDEAAAALVIEEVHGGGGILLGGAGGELHELINNILYGERRRSTCCWYVSAANI